MTIDYEFNVRLNREEIEDFVNRKLKKNILIFLRLHTLKIMVRIMNIILISLPLIMVE